MATRQQGIKGGPKVPAVQGSVIAGPAAIQLAAVTQGLDSFSLWSEQVELRRAGGPQIPGQALLLIQ